jgi:2-dehydro-3-deoxy-D-gluconate 5-dehydrogenase
MTGGNGGIGLGMAKGFASAGATIVIAGKTGLRLNRLCQNCIRWIVQPEFVELDVLKEASCHQAIQRAVERYGRLYSCNNAGQARGNSLALTE